MKKPIHILMIFTFIALMSCSKDDGINRSADTSAVTFNLSTRTPATKIVNITRYIMEVYKTSDLTTAVKRVEQSGSTILVNLENGVNYTCLFWADEVAPNDNTNGTYNAGDLKNVSLNYGKVMGEAFYAKEDVSTDDTAVGVVLKRATAQVTFIETGTIEASKDLEVTFDQYPRFNALTSNAIGTAVEETKIFNTTATTGILGTMLTFASVVGININYKTVFNAETVNNILSVPLKANYITNIRGSYGTGTPYFTFIIVIDDNWEEVIN